MKAEENRSPGCPCRPGDELGRDHQDAGTRDPAEKAQDRPERKPCGGTHAGRGRDADHEAGAQECYPRPAPAEGRHGKRPGQVAGKVGRRQDAGALRAEVQCRLHRRQERGVGKSADAHGDRESAEASRGAANHLGGGCCRRWRGHGVVRPPAAAGPDTGAASPTQPPFPLHRQATRSPMSLGEGRHCIGSQSEGDQRVSALNVQRREAGSLRRRRWRSSSRRPQ